MSNEKISAETLSRLQELQIDLTDIIVDSDASSGSEHDSAAEDASPSNLSQKQNSSPRSDSQAEPSNSSEPTANDDGELSEPAEQFTFAMSSGPGREWVRQMNKPKTPVPISTFNNVVKGPACANCGEVIEGQFVTAVGKNYHPAHFVCTCCSQPFPGGKFLIKDGDLYCENDYYELFSYRCRTCDQIIRDRYVLQGDYYYHINHFQCSRCGDNLSEKKYVENGDEILCVSCNKKIMAAVNEELCPKCLLPIKGKAIEIDGKRMHYEHFVCEECDMPLSENNFNKFEDDYYCNEHYRELMKKICYQCKKPIKGRAVHALMHLWHPEHFCCSICGDNLSATTFFAYEGQAYCKLHYAAIANYVCEYCKASVVTNGIEFLGKHYHADHFLCSSCETPINVKNIREWDSRPYCVKCYKKLPKELRRKYKKKKFILSKIKKKEEAMKKAEIASKKA